jgi:hypothetical protein
MVNVVRYPLVLTFLACTTFDVATAALALAQDAPDPADRQVYFGEEHMHTRNSFDAFTVGVNATWEDAYRFALGEEIELSTTGEKMQRRTPYDFVAITDHSEYYGVLKDLVDPNSPLSKSEFAQGFARGIKDPASGGQYVSQLIRTLVTNDPMEEYVAPELVKGNWQKFIDAADRFYKPGEFTTLYAYEWTSIPNGRNMHRNVFFRDKPPAAPFSAFNSIYPEDLWLYMEIFLGAFAATPIDERYARLQQRNEPLTEIIQTKGASEAHPIMSPNDEFANFELFENLINLGVPSQVRFGYVRQGLVEGMRIESKVGYNPYKMGIVAGGDVHSGYQGNEEWDWKGAHGEQDDTPEKRLDPRPNASGEPGYVVGSAGTTAVWADENTREGIFDGMRRKETYGTSGTLIRLRFFGGWSFPADLTSDPDFVSKAYQTGVTMGGDLAAMPAGATAPTFAVWAMKDPESGNLDRVQIIKGMFNSETGYPQEWIYDVAWSDGRTPDPSTGKLPPVGSTVDVSTATFTNDIGDAALAAVWTDPDFDPSQPAVYYVRVLEIPTPRWSTYDAARNNLPLPTEVPPSIQERAWSSPIWYTPPAQ